MVENTVLFLFLRDFDLPAFKIEIILITSFAFVLLRWKLYGKFMVCV